MAIRKNISLEQALFERQAVICKAFAHPTRIHLLDLLGNGECSMSELRSKLAVSKANLSQHVTVLKAAGVVNTRRNGKHVHCSLTMPQIKQACTLIREVLRGQIRQAQKLQAVS